MAMPMYANAQGDGLFLVLKFGADDGLDTGSYTGSYRHKPACRSYNTIGQARTQRTRFRNQGYGARIAEVTVADGEPSIRWVED
ncbi:hypothetical protein [Mycobacteroides chelonae]|uniref:hypothetical protein n=1 Tax=Mycobacteroides chelonae TaxID=1774 RepID=UPI0009943517|nr:hypothetical protein [Mycobacteroides chelonae]